MVSKQTQPWIVTVLVALLGLLTAMYQGNARKQEETACQVYTEQMFEQFVTALKIAQGEQ